LSYSILTALGAEPITIVADSLVNFATLAVGIAIALNIKRSQGMASFAIIFGLVIMLLPLNLMPQSELAERTTVVFAAVAI
jgi:hypothetical protein